MISREVALVSTATVIGALASSIAFRFFFNTKKHRPRIDLSQNVDLLNKEISPCPFDPSKRKGYLSWDDYFMAIAFLSAERSKDPYRQVGACLVSQHGVILGIGYNGFPRGCPDDQLPWAKRLYVTMFPCNECAKIIIQSGVSEVIYFVEKRINNSDVAYVASHKLLTMAGVKVRKHQPLSDQILIKFEDPRT